MAVALYIEVCFICIAILVVIYIRDARERNNDTYHILFSRVLFANIGFFVADTLWGIMALSEHAHIWQSWAVNILYFAMSGVTAYFWLMFVEQTINPKRKTKWISTLLYILPMVLLIALSFASIETKWLFYIDDMGKYQRGSLFFLEPMLAYALPLYATFRAVYAARKAKNYDRKRQCRSLALFYLFPAIGGVCQLAIKGTPTLVIGIAMSSLWMYFSLQDNIIMLDPLTSMNNRRCFAKLFEKAVHGFDPDSGKRLWLIMMDVDYFKSINDGFGHAEGDRALILIASALNEVAGELDCIAARIGGDEFAVCCQSEESGFSERVSETIRARLAEKSADCRFKFR